MTIYRLTPNEGAPVLRQAVNLKGATSRGLREFPAGLQSVEVVGVTELASLAAGGVPLPVAARHLLAVHKAVQRERAKGEARMEALREKQRDKARAVREEERERLRARREEERAHLAALKVQQKAEEAAEKRRNAAAERRAQKKAAAIQAAAPGPAVLVDPADTRLPWED